jgi:hypothetical protein
VTEYHGGAKCLTRARLRYQFVTTTVIINIVTLCLMAYHQLQAGHFDLWLLLLYLCFVLFLGLRARRLKSRVAEIVDLAAYRAGLQRIRRTAPAQAAAPPKPEPAVEAG